MTTDNKTSSAAWDEQESAKEMQSFYKTLADMQPGGRVRLGEAYVTISDDLLSSMAYAIPGAVETTDKAKEVAARVVEIYLSAQPSPGGQDGPAYEGHTWVSDYVLAGLRERAAMPLQLRNGEVWHWQGDGHDFPESLVCPVIMSAETLRALLAARQPVGEPAAYGVPDGNGGVKFGKGWAFTKQAEQSLGATMPLYAAPPAQAVDLGAMPEGWRLSKKATCYQLSHGNDIIGNLVGPDAEENAAIIARVLDSQAVGNG